MSILGQLLLVPKKGIKWQADFRPLALGAASSLPGNLSFSRALNNNSTSETVQTSPSTVISSGLTANVPRIGQAGNDGTRGLSFEESRGNLVHSRSWDSGNGWQTGANTTNTMNATTGPDGVANAGQANVGANGMANWEGGFSANIIACWVRAVSGTATHVLTINGFPTYITGQQWTVGTTWQKTFVSTAVVGGGGGQAVLENAGALDTVHSTAARNVYLDLIEVIGARLFPTEATLGAKTTRAGERLWLADRGLVIESGRLGFETRFIPKGGAAHYANTNPRFWYIDANNYCEFDKTTLKVNVRIAGTTWTTASALAFNANDVVDLWVEAGGSILNSKVVYRVNGGAPTVIGTTTPQGNLSASGALDLFCQGTSTQLSSWIQYMQAYSVGAKPSWVA